MAGQQDQHDQRDDYDDAPEPGEDDDGGGGEESRILSLESISEAIKSLEAKVERALGGGGGGGRTAPQPASSGSSSRPTLAQQGDETRKAIREELAALKAQERADAERGELLTRLGKVEKAVERAPRQLRKIEERMGWHRP